MQRAELASKCNSKAELIKVLRHEGRFFLPKKADITMNFLSQALLEGGNKSVFFLLKIS